MDIKEVPKYLASESSKYIASRLEENLGGDDYLLFPIGDSGVLFANEFTPYLSKQPTEIIRLELGPKDDNEPRKIITPSMDDLRYLMKENDKAFLGDTFVETGKTAMSAFVGFLEAGTNPDIIVGKDYVGIADISPQQTQHMRKDDYIRETWPDKYKELVNNEQFAASEFGRRFILHNLFPFVLNKGNTLKPAKREINKFFSMI